MFSSGNTDTRRVGDTSAQTGVSRSTRGEDGCERSRATVHWKWARAVAGLGERESYSKTNILVLGSWAHPTGGARAALYTEPPTGGAADTGSWSLLFQTPAGSPQLSSPWQGTPPVQPSPSAVRPAFFPEGRARGPGFQSTERVTRLESLRRLSSFFLTQNATMRIYLVSFHPYPRNPPAVFIPDELENCAKN